MRPPPLPPLLALALLLSACAAPAPPPLEGGDPSTSRLSAHLARLGGGEGEGARRLAYAAEQLQSAGLQPVYHGAFEVRAGDAGGAYALGYVAGRNPTVSSELVLLAAEAGPDAAGVLEAARLLAEGARASLLPERTVGVAVWGVGGAEAFLARPPWALDQVARVLLVAEDTLRAAPARELWAARGVPVSWVAPAPARPEAGRAAAQRLATAYRLGVEAHLAARAAAATPLSAPFRPSDAATDRRLP